MSKHEAIGDGPLCLSFEIAAARLGVPKESLRRVADDLGMTIRMGRFVGLYRDDLKELIEKCRVEQKAPASTGETNPDKNRIGKSETQGTCGSQPALSAAKRLRSNSRTTSAGKHAQVVQLTRLK